MTELLHDPVERDEAAVLADAAVGADVDGADPVATTPATASARQPLGWGVLVVALGAYVGGAPISDNSMLTHLATGRLIRAGAVPRFDPYGLSGARWVAQSWLASWWYATLEAAGGAGLLRLFGAAAGAALAALVWRLSRPSPDVLARVALAGTAVAVGIFWWTTRPQLIAYLLFAALLLVVVERRSPGWLVAMGALWVNVHGSWPIGVVVLAVWAGLGVVEGRTTVRRAMTLVAAAVVGVALGAALSPYGADLIRFPFDMAQRSATLAFIREWRRPELAAPGTAIFLMELVVVALSLWRRRARTAGVVAVGLAALPLLGARNLALASIALVPLSARYVSGLRAGRTPVTRAPRRVLVVLLVGLLAVSAAASPHYELSPYPTRAVDWLESQGWVANPSVRLVSHDFVGGYLEWRYGTRAHPWLDDRVELTSYERLHDYVMLLSGDPHFEATLDRQQPDLVLWMADEPLADQLAHSRLYRIVYRDHQAIVACRIDGAVGC